MGSQPLGVADDQPPVDELRHSIIAAARQEFVRFGIRRANMEEIARRAGVARVTVYRRFDGKPALLRAVVMADILGFVEVFDAALFADAPPEDRLVDAAVLAIRELRRNALVVTTLRSDPELLLSSLTLDGQNQFESVRDLITTRVVRLLDEAGLSSADVEHRSEVALRLVYTTVLLPFGALPGQTDEELRSFARRFIAPVILGG